jgi:hypothetical protein
MLHFEVEKTNPCVLWVCFFFIFEISIFIFFGYPRIPSRRSRKPTYKKHVALGLTPLVVDAKIKDH